MRNILTLVFMLGLSSLIAQETIFKPRFLKYPMDSLTKIQFDKSIEVLFQSINEGKINENLLSPSRVELTKSQLQELVNYETNKDSSLTTVTDKQLINLYPISENQYSFSLSYINETASSKSVLYYSIHLIASQSEGEFTFSVPIDYLTRYWKTETIGNITYHFRSEINRERAKRFDDKNTLIAKKLGLQPEQLDYYMCDDYQEISKLLGFEYSIFSNGQYRDGYGVDAQTIFSVMNQEDFSHDIFHYYSGQVNKAADRNWITEEGIAYLWGNAYYTDSSGNNISHERLVEELKSYLSQNPDTNLFEFFKRNTKIFQHIAPEVSIRSTISGIIAKEVEKQKGMEGILALINAGSKDRLKSYLKQTNELLGINEANFTVEVRRLIDKW